MKIDNNSIIFVLNQTNILKKQEANNNTMVGNKGIVKTTKNPYAGMIDKGADFFKVNGVLYCSHDFRVWVWPEFPSHIVQIIREDMLNNPDAMKALASWENLLPEDWVRRYIACRFGGLDDQPDIGVDGQVHHTEYVDCELRGTCRYEGKLCCSLKAKMGVISPAEMAVLKLADQPIKIIADKCCISEDTVKSHLKSIKDKTGMGDKTEVAIYAYKKGLISK